MTYANKLRTLDTTGMTSREVAGAIGCNINTARNLLRYLQMPYRKSQAGGVVGLHHEVAGPDFTHIEQEWRRLMRGRSFGAPRRARNDEHEGRAG